MLHCSHDEAVRLVVRSPSLLTLNSASIQRKLEQLGQVSGRVFGFQPITCFTGPAGPGNFAVLRPASTHTSTTLTVNNRVHSTVNV